MKCSHQDPAGKPCSSGSACLWYVAALERALRSLLQGASGRVAHVGTHTERVIHVHTDTFDAAQRVLYAPPPDPLPTATEDSS